ncbi:MAG: metallophosphoesterase [Myxococcales bacterium]|nr:metallophosphoesterase [Myxococcales bacterium]
MPVLSAAFSKAAPRCVRGGACRRGRDHVQLVVVHPPLLSGVPSRYTWCRSPRRRRASCGVRLWARNREVQRASDGRGSVAKIVFCSQAGRGHRTPPPPSAAVGRTGYPPRGTVDDVALVGLISDTHDLVRPEAVAALDGVDVILHAGDVCTPEVIAALSRIAPVHAVRGNNDRGAWASDLPEADVVEIGGVSIYVLHDLHALDLDPAAAGFAVVVTGHSHQPKIEKRGGVLYLNPGGAGPRRFRLPVSVALLRIEGGEVDAEIVELLSDKSR